MSAPNNNVDHSRQFLADPRRRQIARLLKHELPKMQPSALKHEYLTSVANVNNNPVASSVEPDGARRIVGFGDVNRTLPLMILRETDGSIRHAFVPNPRDERDQPLLKVLQEQEHVWAADRGVPGRDILAEMRLRHREDINRHGLNRYLPRTPFNDADLEEIQTGKWYPTRPIDIDVELRERPMRSDPEHRAKLEQNIARSADMVAGRRSDTRITGVELARTTPDDYKMRVASIRTAPAAPAEPTGPTPIRIAPAAPAAGVPTRRPTFGPTPTRRPTFGPTNPDRSDDQQMEI